MAQLLAAPVLEPPVEGVVVVVVVVVVLDDSLFLVSVLVSLEELSLDSLFLDPLLL
jgi:hypothetical protein